MVTVVWHCTGHTSQTLLVLHLRAQSLEEGVEYPPTLSCGAWVGTLPLPLTPLGSVKIKNLVMSQAKYI